MVLIGDRCGDRVEVGERIGDLMPGDDSTFTGGGQGEPYVAPALVTPYVWSSMVAFGAFFFTDAMPLSRAAPVVYVSLVPITSWLAAFRLNMN
jgi:hypothetical protein